MFNSYPRLILKENRKVLSDRDARLWINIARTHSKLCLFGLYAFEKWRDNRPLMETVILDVIALTGGKGTLEKLGAKFLKEGRQSLFMFDGETYLLIVEHDGTPLEKVKVPLGTELIKDKLYKFTYPNTENGNTGIPAEIIRRFKN